MDNLDVVIFTEKIREKMQTTNPSLVRQRRPLIRSYPDVFVGNEAVNWATNNADLSNLDDKNNNDGKPESTTAATKVKVLDESEVVCFFQRLMDAGMLRNVITMEGFQNDKSLYRFSSDDIEGNEFVRSAALGYRLFKSACVPNSGLFQKVCEFGQLVSSECIKASDIVSWIVSVGFCQTRDAAVVQGKLMCDHKIIKPVDSEVSRFGDDRAFYVFAVDYRRKPLPLRHFLNSRSAARDCSSRNKLIHLRQTSDHLMDLSLYASSNGLLPKRSSRHKGLSISSDDSGYDTVSPPTYKTLLKSDGSMTSEALLHPSAPYVRKDLKIFPDPVGYGFVVRGSGPCFVKIVDPDSPAGKAGLQAKQFIIDINGSSVTELPHTDIEDLILNGPKFLRIGIMEHTNAEQRRKLSESTPAPPVTPSTPTTPGRVRSSPPLPTAQPWIKRRDSYREIQNSAVMSRS